MSLLYRNVKTYKYTYLYTKKYCPPLSKESKPPLFVIDMNFGRSSGKTVKKFEDICRKRFGLKNDFPNGFVRYRANCISNSTTNGTLQRFSRRKYTSFRLKEIIRKNQRQTQHHRLDVVHKRD